MDPLLGKPPGGGGAKRIGAVLEAGLKPESGCVKTA
jgi:hypothetical protein